MIQSGLEALILAEPQLTHYDTMVGDGDCGLCLKNGAEAIIEEMKKDNEWSDPVQVVSRIAQTIETNMDGTSGALYAIFFNSMAFSLSNQASQTSSSVTTAMWTKSLQYAIQSLGKYTPARPGDRTLIDSLAPFVQTMGESGDFLKATEAARHGCEKTKSMEASLGRSVYVGGDNWKNCPDPGAYGVVSLLAGMGEAMSSGT